MKTALYWFDHSSKQSYSFLFRNLDRSVEPLLAHCFDCILLYRLSDHYSIASHFQKNPCKIQCMLPDQHIMTTKAQCLSCRLTTKRCWGQNQTLKWILVEIGHVDTNTTLNECSSLVYMPSVAITSCMYPVWACTTVVEAQCVAVLAVKLEGVKT